MPEFPRLKTNAVTQYPAARSTSFSNGVARFVDGREQRYRQSAGALRTWTIRLELLDEGEAAALEQFYTDLQGAFGTFTFTDPRDGSTHDNCSLEGDEAWWHRDGEMRSGMVLVIRENPA